MAFIALAAAALACAGSAWAQSADVQEPAPAQEEQVSSQEVRSAGDPEKVEFRVTSARGNFVNIDRGTADGLRSGDRVFFLPREGGTFAGTISEALDRSSLVELVDPGFLPGPGTRGMAQVSADRFEAPAVKPAEESPVQATETNAQEAREQPTWTNQDSEFTPNQPLLAKVQPVRPEERPPSVTGRTYFIADQIWSSEDDRKDGFFRLGADVEYENLTGIGDALHLEGEINVRRTEVPDDDDESQGRLRPERISYSLGGTRFAPDRLEFGRFLSRGMSEFGVIDGFEWGRRLPSGDSYGASIGWMPEPDKSFESLQDFQVSTYYRWIADASEQLSAAAGFQKTFHNSNADRDLAVGKLAYLPPKGWNFSGTVWVDYYTSGDEEKGSGVDLTQAYLTSGTRSEDGATLDFIYSHMEFPEIDREEFLPVEDDQLADDHNDRLAVRLRSQASADSRWRAALGVWADEDEEGADGEVGWEQRNFIFQQSVTDLSIFGANGRHSDSLGGRLSLSWNAPQGRWALDYEFAANQIDTFSDNNNDIPQHRLRLNRDYQTQSGWSFSGNVELGFWDDENSVALGVYLQRSF